jgi:hypothetical protein
MERTKATHPVLEVEGEKLVKVLGKAKNKIESTTEEEVFDTKLRWKKLGGGSLRIAIGGQNRIIKPGEEFWAEASELPKSCMDLLQCLDATGLKASEVKERSKSPVIPVVYTLQKVEGEKDLWNLVDTEGKVLNESLLSKESADELLTTINAE